MLGSRRRAGTAYGLFVDHSVLLRPRIVSKRVGQRNHRATGRFLSPREWTVVNQAASGNTIKEMAYTLGLTENTVKTYISGLRKAHSIEGGCGNFVLWCQRVSGCLQS
jgi:DNA-binding NarL/FixJ family response regulator